MSEPRATGGFLKVSNITKGTSISPSHRLRFLDDACFALCAGGLLPELALA